MDRFRGCLGLYPILFFYLSLYVAIVASTSPCAVGMYDCGDNSTCTDINGLFTCVCNEGYDFGCAGYDMSGGLRVGTLSPEGCDSCLSGVAYDIGKTTYIVMPGSTYGGSGLTYSTWINVRGARPYYSMMYARAGSSNGHSLLLWSGNKLRFSLQHTRGTRNIDTENAVPEYTWMYVAVVFSGNAFSMYLNGALVGSNSPYWGEIQFNRQWDYVRWGATSYDRDNAAPVWVSDFLLFKRGLSTAEMQTLYTGAGTVTVPTVPLAPCLPGKVCKNVDECSLGTDNCGANTVCSDNEGSFTCTCNAVYYWIGGDNICLPCKRCDSGTEYMTSTCTSTSDTVCSPCRTSCPAQYMLVGTCTHDGQP
eukprot:3941058-Rhodomonas_salina.1